MKFRSIGTQLTLWYAAMASLSAALLFVAGYFLLENQLVRGLDQLISAEFKHIDARLGDDLNTLTSFEIDNRIRETTEYSSILFFFTISSPKAGILFNSTNLNGQVLPDVRGQRRFNADVPGVGELRIEEFVMGPFDVHIGTPLAQVREFPCVRNNPEKQADHD